MSKILKRERRTLTLEQLIGHPIADYTIMALIVISVLLLLGEYYFVSEAPAHTRVMLAGDLITVVFGIELTFRFAIAKKKRRFFRRYWPDILAVLPIARPFRFFRLLRLLRLFQLGLLLDRRVSALRGVLRVNIYLLWALVVVTGIVVVGAGVLVFLFESHETLGFGTLEESMWWALHSIIAGEPVSVAPRTTAGRMLLVGVMLSGMTLFAVFTGIVSATMIDRLQGRPGVGEMDVDELEGHIIVCGWNAGLFAFLSELAVDRELRRLPVLLVNELESLPDLTSTGLRAENVYFLRGDHTQLGVLERAGVRRASRAVVVADTIHDRPYKDRDARTVLATLTIERLNPDIYCVVELMDEANQQHLQFAGVEAIIMRNELGGISLASACRHPELMRIARNLLTLRHGETMQRIVGPKARTTFGELSHALKREQNALLIGIETPGKGSVVNPAVEFVVEPSDYLIVIM